jgi:hypothetical protein
MSEIGYRTRDLDDVRAERAFRGGSDIEHGRNGILGAGKRRVIEERKRGK